MPCENCDRLDHSCDTKPAVPDGGTCNDILYVCPCGQRWWQYNTHFHLWQRANTDRQWEGLKEDLRAPAFEDY